MNTLQTLIDKKANHECKNDDGTCMYCEQVDAEIYALTHEKGTYAN